ncbi:MAG: DUF2723 domain-containing protein [Phycisphaerae bacterium]|nr:DUF2723 domain-containing protein [Phycisphaerae bacterium]
MIQYRAWHGDVEGRLGLALSHPLYYIVAIGAGHVPLGEFGRRVNCVSAFFGAIAAANLFLLVRLWLGRIFPAVIAAVTLALSHTFWWHASIAETYTLWAALFLGELICLLQYTRTHRTGFLHLLGLLNGMAVAVHMLGSIPLACYAVFVVILLLRRAIRPKDAAVIAVLWIIGALPYECLIVREFLQSGDLVGTLASAAFGSRWQADVLNTTLSWKIARENLLLLGLNFPTPNILLFLAGCYGLRRIQPTAFRNVVLAAGAMFLVFAFRYTVPDRYAFFIPFYCLVAVGIGVGAQEVMSRTRRRHMPCLIVAFSLLPVGVYAAAPELAERANLRIGTRQDIPYRNDYEYFLRPWKIGYIGAERFATEAMEGVEEDAIIHADITTVFPLLYVQEIKGVRPDVRIVSTIASTKGAPPLTEQTMDMAIVEHPVYVVSRAPGYCPAFILEKYPLVQAGLLWRVTRGTQEH